MAQFKVTLTFFYDSEDDISDWNIEVPFDYITTREQALEVAIAEMENNNLCDFNFEVKEIQTNY